MKIIECPRDAMQGFSEFIPTERKIEYINQLLKVGFDTLDFGSFVSGKIIPQLRDTEEVLHNLNLNNTSTRLLAIIANMRGAISACCFPQIEYLGFPLSVSEEFQKRNTNKSIQQALNTVKDIKNLSIKHNKQLVVYLSMAFGNPYKELYHADIVAELTHKLSGIQVEIIALSDTIGVSNAENIAPLFSTLIRSYPSIEFGAHFHTTIDTWQEKINAAYENGCKRFDSALKGHGGCPMANNKLVGNMPTEKLIGFLKEDLHINLVELDKSLQITDAIFR